MWNINPKVLCSQHLRGEHSECHMFVGVLKRGNKIDGYIKNQLLQPRLLFKRHDDLAKEMVFRKMSHKSPINQDWSIFDYLTPEQFNATINVYQSYKDLYDSC
jgi:hypothetical protein